MFYVFRPRRKITRTIFDPHLRITLEVAAGHIKPKSDGYVLLTKAIRMKNGNRPLRERALHADLLTRTALSLLPHVLVLHDWTRR